MAVVWVCTEDELAKCLDIRREVFVVEQGVPLEEEIDEQDNIAVGHHIYVTDEQGDAVATARYQAYDAVTAKIQRVAVRAADRKSGFGRMAMDAIEMAARQAGFQRAVLDAQCHAEAFYRQLGYVTVSDEPFDDAGILHVRMEKDLSAG